MNDSFTIDLAEVLQAKYPHGFHAPADIDINTFLEFADDDWSIDLDEYLAKRHLVAVIWNLALVLNERPDLTDEQAWKVLQACQPEFENVTDTVRRTVLRVSDKLFPKPTGKAGLRAMLASIERRIDALPAEVSRDPASYGSIASLLDSVETLIKGDGSC
jgi:hypothetical protein